MSISCYTVCMDIDLRARVAQLLASQGLGLGSVPRREPPAIVVDIETAKRPSVPATGVSRWLCPKCRRFVTEPMGRMCEACRAQTKKAAVAAEENSPTGRSFAATMARAPRLVRRPLVRQLPASNPTVHTLAHAIDPTGTGCTHTKAQITHCVICNLRMPTAREHTNACNDICQAAFLEHLPTSAVRSPARSADDWRSRVYGSKR